jgi:hypothetical protein
MWARHCRTNITGCRKKKLVTWSKGEISDRWEIEHFDVLEFKKTRELTHGAVS